MFHIRAKPVHPPLPAKSFFAVTEAPKQAHADGIAGDIRAGRPAGSDGAADGHFAGRLCHGRSRGEEEDQKRCNITHPRHLLYAIAAPSASSSSSTFLRAFLTCT